MLRLEFAHYDLKALGTISAKDFVLSMVASADMRYIDKFLSLVDELDGEASLRDERITYEEFKNFAELRRKLEPFSVAIFSYGKVNGLLTKKDFKRAAQHVYASNILTVFSLSTSTKCLHHFNDFLYLINTGLWHLPHRQSHQLGVLHVWYKPGWQPKLWRVPESTSEKRNEQSTSKGSRLRQFDILLGELHKKLFFKEGILVPSRHWDVKKLKQTF